MTNPPTLTIHTLNIDPDEEDHYSSSSSPSDEEESFSESESGSGLSEEEDEDEEGGQAVGQGAEGKGKGKEKERSGSVDGDFDRLIQGIRSQTSTGTTLIKDWDMSFVAQQEAEFKDDLREASGVGRKRRKDSLFTRPPRSLHSPSPDPPHSCASFTPADPTLQKGRTTGPTLSHQVKSLIGEANQAYIDSNLPLTIDLMTEVIRIEPRASAAWSVLAQCYDDLSDSHTALKLRVMAAHLRNDAEEWERLGRKSREMGLVQQALYCFGKMTQVDPENMEYLWDRAVFAKEVGEGRVARSCFLGILKRYPNDLVVLREVHPILVECGELGVCAQLLQQAFEFHLRGRSDEGGGGENNPNRLTILDVLLLADLYNALGAYEKAVDVIRKGVRWLQGREDQRYWDLCEDDREYDLPGTIRDANGNTLVAPPSGEDVSATIPPPGSGSGSGSLGPGVGPGGIGGIGVGGGPNAALGGGAPQTPLPLPGRPGAGMQPGYYPLDTNARHRLAVARIKMGDVDEGKVCALLVRLCLSAHCHSFLSLFPSLPLRSLSAHASLTPSTPPTRSPNPPTPALFAHSAYSLTPPTRSLPLLSLRSLSPHASLAQRHASIILSEDVLDYAVLFSEIADAYFEREMWAEARPIYELLGGDPATSSIYVLLQTAACMRNLEQLKEAAEVYEHSAYPCFFAFCFAL
ncbi:RNA polymerase III transcription factor [Coprinopsis cinerea okayama7|uniref:RNA polymerase III transcription factor n=1 Tax=Coprinopsis cinerea (strain Okayama-7 / 130 / ATCC MYA-4618 / FGSC 9003) TaxID=240176 RepID=A8NKP0_COPC7|nr:RNA polymerase III transcription factor [Coprinopsis cinerea okayama7\|eukprot:XP_001834504.2 RNA polymerase III transcription factor [Coprinopsis cinerea okayama7\